MRPAWLAVALTLAALPRAGATAIEAVPVSPVRINPSGPVAVIVDARSVLFRAPAAASFSNAQTPSFSAGRSFSGVSASGAVPLTVTPAMTVQPAAQTTPVVPAGAAGGTVEAAPGALEFVRALAEKKVPIVATGGESRAELLAKLRQAGFLKYIPEEMVVGADTVAGADGLPMADAVERSVARHYPGHEIVRVDAQSGGARAAMALLKPSRKAQEDAAAGKMPTEAGPAKEIPLVLPASREGPLSLHIEVSDDLKSLTYSRVMDDEELRKAGLAPNWASMKLEKLARFASSYLISPTRSFGSLPEKARAVIERIWPEKKRYTTYRGVTVSWDADADKDVWTTNIDTVYILKQVEDAGLFKAIDPRVAVEVGTGGGHMAAFIANRSPRLKQLSITDISLYALRAAKRNVAPYMAEGAQLKTFLGRGIDALPGDQDLMLVNPPYIPEWPEDPGAAVDPYRGTGLVRDLLLGARAKLNRTNKQASLVIGISSMTEPYFRDYLKEAKGQWKVEEVGKPLEVPLKILGINDGWRDWLVKQGGLRRRDDVAADQEKYWHTLRVYRLTPQ